MRQQRQLEAAEDCLRQQRQLEAAEALDVLTSGVTTVEGPYLYH